MWPLLIPAQSSSPTFLFISVSQTATVKLQAVTLAAKLLVLSPAHIALTQLAKYVFALARYDRNYDVRDRGRMLQQLLAGVVPDIGAADAMDVGGVVLRRAQVRVVLFEGKENAAPLGAQGDTARERLGTLGLVLGRDITHARVLPDWLEHGVESSLRHSPDDAFPTPSVTAIGHVAAVASSSSSSSRPVFGPGSGGHSTPIVVLTPAGSGGPSPAGSVPNQAGWADLDKFYASEGSEEEEDDDDDDEEEEEEEEEDDDEGGEGEEESEDGEEDEHGEGEENGERSEAEEESDRQSGYEGDRGAGPPRFPEEEEEGKGEDGSSKVVPVQ